MKNSSFVVALPALALSALLLSGCGAFRSEKAWKAAQQESPLEIPPGLDRPSTSDALVIPPRGANNPVATGATADVPGAAAQISDAFVVAGAPDAVYQQVGQALAGGELGTVSSSDAATHSYAVAVSGAVAKRGFFSRMFHRNKGATGAPGQVQVTVGPSGQGSEVRAQGPAPAVAKVIDGLKSRLGG